MASAPMHDLTNKDGVLAYVRAEHPHLLPCTISLLSGGYANYVWAIRPDPHPATAIGASLASPTDARRRNIVLKFYPPHARYEESIVLPQGRALAEYNALVHVHALERTATDGSWSVPEPIHYDPRNHLVLMAEVEHAVPLLSYLQKASGDDAAPRDLATLRAIGTALADFHATITSQSVQDIQPWFKNQDMAAFFVLQRDFSSLAHQHALPDAKLWVDRALGPRGFAHTHQTLIFGDFWPNSVLVHVGRRRPGVPLVTIIDWECHRPGHAGEDVAQMVANLFIMLQGEPYDHDAVRVVLDTFVKAVRAGVQGKPVFGDGYDVEAMTVRQVTSLVQYPHWGIKDDKAVVGLAADGGVRQALRL